MISAEKIRKLTKNVNDITEDFVDYVSIYQVTNEVLTAIYGEEITFNYDIIIDIEKIAEELDVFTVEQPISLDRPLLAKTVNKRNLVEEGLSKTILIDDERDKEWKRFALAKHLYYHLKYYDCVKCNIESTVSPKQYTDMQEIIAELFARFLLLPPTIVTKEFSVYEKSSTKILKPKEWYKYLSIVSLVPEEVAIIGWQQARIVSKLLNM